MFNSNSASLYRILRKRFWIFTVIHPESRNFGFSSIGFITLPPHLSRPKRAAFFYAHGWAVLRERAQGCATRSLSGADNLSILTKFQVRTANGTSQKSTRICSAIAQLLHNAIKGAIHYCSTIFIRGGEPRRVVIARTRCKYIHVSSGRDVLSLTVPGLYPHPDTGHTWSI